MDDLDVDSLNVDELAAAAADRAGGDAPFSREEIAARVKDFILRMGELPKEKRQELIKSFIDQKMRSAGLGGTAARFFLSPNTIVVIAILVILIIFAGLAYALLRRQKEKERKRLEKKEKKKQDKKQPDTKNKDKKKPENKKEDKKKK